MKIEFDNETVEIKSGEMIAVPHGEGHKPFAENEHQVMLVEPKGVSDTSNVKGDLTAPIDECI